MPRRQPTVDIDALAMLDELREPGSRRLSLDDQCDVVRQVRELMPSSPHTVDRWLVSEMSELRRALENARERQQELKKLHDRLTSPPWYAAAFLRPVEGAPDKIVVSYSGTPRVVTLPDDVKAESLAVGDDVLLAHDLNTVMRRLSPPVTRACEVAAFQQSLGDGRLVLKTGETEVIVRAAGSLDVAALTCGERVRWDSTLALAFERVPRPSDSDLFLVDMPTERFADIGGLDDQIERLQWNLRLHVQHQDLVGLYRVRRAASVLLVGPPGTGKTMLARALAGWLGEEAPAGRAHFMHIKPGALHSMWYSQSEANYREAFRIARETGARSPGMPVVMFFDEVEAIGMTRSGGATSHVDDRVITSLMAELDGLQARGHVLVVAATNRRDAIDPALLRPGRLGDLVVEIPRPTMAAARAILERHLPAAVPYAPAAGSDDPRREIIDLVVSRLYAPNGEGEVGRIIFRDGSRRTIEARELVNGAILANVARTALERACLRDLQTDDRGVRPADVLDALTDELVNAVGALTPANCHTHLGGLPQDLSVVRVEPVVRRVRRPHRFTVAA